ncbi:hypothetical protein WS64_23405 [Burkholderia anthina]|uniref:Uncharacterized protein n=1 Tax=Burkholderia anthina TaxID=179879 RepID=A0AAW3PRU8_9BURK|nr:hypothetical protein WS64_23405 [Burkholderia anthina]
MTGPLARFDCLGSMDDAQFFRDKALAGQRLAGVAAHRLLLAQGLDHRLLQAAAGMGINRRVDRFMTDALLGIIWMHLAKSGSNLLGDQRR